jgi:hypothetical protein
MGEWSTIRNIAFEKALVTKVESGDIVLTHHLPAPESVAPKFARSSRSSGFTGTPITAATT